MSDTNNLVGYAKTTQLDHLPNRPDVLTGPAGNWGRDLEHLLRERARAKEEILKEKPKAPAVEMYQAGTGAVRSSDLKKERWDLLSGAALRRLKEAMGLVSPGDQSAKGLVELAADYLWRYLGYDANGTGVRDRFELLTKGWAWLALAMEAEEGVAYIPGARYPMVAVRRMAMACKEGETKYGEENWHNGFRVKILANHSLRHMVRFSNGVVEDDELGHACWGFMAAVHMNLFRPDMCDLLVAENYTITEELQKYHVEHISRRQLVLAKEAEASR